MIRKLQKADINKVADIWLNTNIKAHYFIPAQYWKSNFESPQMSRAMWIFREFVRTPRLPFFYKKIPQNDTNVKFQTHF